MEVKIEVSDFTFPIEEFVFGKGVTVFDRGGDGTILDTPESRRALPLIESFTVEKALRFCGMGTQGEEEEG